MSNTTHDLTVDDVLAEPALVKTHDVRLVAPAMVVICEVGAPPRLEVANCSTRGESAALTEFLDTNELALDIRAAYFQYAADDPVVHERREQYVERLAKATIPVMKFTPYK